MKLFGQKPTLSAWFGLTVVAIFIFISLFTPWLAPYAQSANIGETWAEPSKAMWLGGDQIGRDMLTRILYGTRMTIGVALAITLLSFFIGIVLT